MISAWLGGWTSAAKSRQSTECQRLRALEHVLEQTADRVAQAELRAEQFQHRAGKAEDALIKTQVSLDYARSRNDSPSS